MTQRTYELQPIDAEVAAALRNSALRNAALRDSGGPVYVADEHPGYPCRQCLRDAEVGEELVLVSYDPFTGTSAYRSASPIFLHTSDCSSNLDAGTTSELPVQLTRRQLSVRSFDSEELMIDAAVIDGSQLASTLDSFFADVAASKIHVHNASRGCWAVSVARRPA